MSEINKNNNNFNIGNKDTDEINEEFGNELRDFFQSLIDEEFDDDDEDKDY